MKTINRMLKERGLVTWMDEEQMEGEVVESMAAGIDSSKTCVVFVTKNYHDKVNSDNEGDNCRLEFNYAMGRKTPKQMISVVMEQSSGDFPEMRRPAQWSGAVGMALGGKLYIDLSGDEGAPQFSKKVDELVARINRLTNASPAPVISAITPASSAAVPASDSGSQPSQSSNDIAAADAEISGEGLYVFLALQAPPMVSAEATVRVGMHQRLINMALLLEKKKQKLVADRSFPLCLSDASACTCDVELQLRRGLIYCLVWCGEGDGWEPREDVQRIPTLQSITTTIALPATSPPPHIAVLCLKSNAARAAERLLGAGVNTVMWLTVDMDGDAAAQVFTEVILPALKHLQDGDHPESVAKFIQATLSEMGEIQPGLTPSSGKNCGCISQAIFKEWLPASAPEARPWLTKQVPEVLHEVNPSSNSKQRQQLSVYACDLHYIKITQDELRESGRVMIVSEDVKEAALRRRSIAHSIYTAAQYRQGQQHVCHASTATDVQDGLQRMSSVGTFGPTLLWLDLLGKVATAADLDVMKSLLEDEDIGVLLTCDDAMLEDDELMSVVEEFVEDIECSEVDIGEQVYPLDVHTDDCHDRIKLFSVFEERGPMCLLDVFEPRQLSAALQSAMGGRPIAGVYRADERSVRSAMHQRYRLPPCSSGQSSDRRVWS